MFTPTTLPVLYGLAAGFAVRDRWFSSVPTETMPNRAFVCTGTSQGHLDDHTKTFTCPSIFGSLGAKGLDWRIYGCDADSLTRLNFSDTTSAPDTHFGCFVDFQAAAADGSAAALYVPRAELVIDRHSQHPNYDVALGEQLIHDVYYALRGVTGWNETLLVVTYDEYGACYDHVPPPVRRDTTR